ncbi:hypothetical protein LOD99_6720 [Oopsacas minuta]|uniref:GOLD domain-containing protein n=1 Tax=Oopsacas minuta TaxID=111878 RepID=A0AAV7JMA4_9METZ|nr:hypothetical protein LOD99_6720 [Oopsacas minuta]
MKLRIFCSLILLSLLRNSYSYFIEIDAHAEECFFDTVKAHTKIGITFEVVEGGFYDIDVLIFDPEERPIHTGVRESNGKYTFAAANDGTYKYCFSNKMSTMTPKVLKFSVDMMEPTSSDLEGGSTGLEAMIQELSKGLTVVKHEQEYMEVRERIHRMINDNTNSRVVWWSFFEALILFLVTIGQIYYLKRFFEVRRVI